jgi:hypothetical protein
MTIFVKVKILKLISLIVIVFVVTGCPATNYESDSKKIQNNNMNFPNLEKQYYNGIKYKLSDMFENDYDDDYVLTDNASTKIVYGLDVNFSIEAFNQEEAEVIQYAFDDEIDLFNAVHDNYVLKRKASLYEPSISIKKPTPKNVGYPGYIQVINGSPYSYDEDEGSSYFTATLNIDGIYYVFQLIGKKSNMGYLYDDFIDILSSVEK